MPTLLVALLVAEPTREATVNTLADAFWAVSAYVAVTLAIYHYLALFFDRENSITRLYNHSRSYQVFFASLLGALPGCGGAIVVTTQFISGRVGFGAIVAVLTSTMGDAAFLLLASKPDIGLGVVVIGIIVGTLTGLIINTIHQDEFLRPMKTTDAISQESCHNCHIDNTAINLQGRVWKWLLIPSSIVAVLQSFQININELLHLPELSIEWLGAVLIVLCMSLWALTKEIGDYQSTVSEDTKCIASHPIQKAAQDTNFVTAWVLVAFLAFELTTTFTGFNPQNQLSGWGVWMPLVGLTVGMLPGCGPQILITSLFISGAVPLSTQLANAISNDGDALFPAIAMAPKAALVATIYTALPALIVGYGYYFLFEI